MALAFLLCFPFWSDLSWAVPPPVLEVVNPLSIVKDSVGVSIAVSGTGFTPSMVVKWNSLDLATTIYGLTSAVAVVPDSLLTSVGVGVVSVSNSNGVSNSIGITVVESMSTELAPVLYVAAGLLGAMAFILGFGLRL